MNYTEIKVPKQGDQQFKLPVTDETGAPIDLTVFSHVLMVLYSPDKTIIAKYSAPAATGWKTMTIGGAGSNELSFTLQSVDTNLAKQGKVLIEIRTRLADGTLADGEYDSIVRDIYLCTITDSLTSGLTLP